jgi:hypothetical protein
MDYQHPVPQRLFNSFLVGVGLECRASLFFFFFAVLGLELRAYTLSHSTSPVFLMGFFEIGCGELFAQVGFELLFS